MAALDAPASFPLTRRDMMFEHKIVQHELREKKNTKTQRLVGKLIKMTKMILLVPFARQRIWCSVEKYGWQLCQCHQ